MIATASRALSWAHATLVSLCTVRAASLHSPTPTLSSLCNPSQIIRTDADKAFSSELFGEALSVVGTKHDPVLPYTHHAMGLLERANKPVVDLLRKLCGHACIEWVRWIALVAAWRNSSVNRNLGVSPHEALFCRKSTFAYDRLAAVDSQAITPNELGNLCAAMEVSVRTAAAVSSARVAAQYDSERDPPPSFTVGSSVLVYFPDRESKVLTFYRGPFEVIAADPDDANYYTVRDMIQLNEYSVHVERMKPFDMSRTSLTEQADRQLPSRDFGIVVAVDSHRMNDAHGLYEFCIRFYSGYRAWQLYPQVEKLDVVKEYVAKHQLNTRKQTPVQVFGRLTGQYVSGSPRPAPRNRPPAPAVPAPPQPAVPAPRPAPRDRQPAPLPPQPVTLAASTLSPAPRRSPRSSAGYFH
jgi:hypothetical protein